MGKGAGGAGVMPATLRLLAAGVVVILAMSVVWKVQDWRYGKQLAEQASLHQGDLSAIRNAAAYQVCADHEKRLALEQRLSVSEKTHYKELSDAQTNQVRLRDRLATADLQLSVLLAEDSVGGCSVPADTGAGGMVYGRARTRLAPAHAQRIIGITDAGDQGLIALAACQAHVRMLSKLRADEGLLD